MRKLILYSLFTLTAISLLQINLNSQHNFYVIHQDEPPGPPNKKFKTIPIQPAILTFESSNNSLTKEVKTKSTKTIKLHPLFIKKKSQKKILFP